MTALAHPFTGTTDASREAPPSARLARGTGLWYVGLAVAGMLGFLVVRPQVFDPESTTVVADLTSKEGLARIGVALELATVVTQALLAVWFFRLFRRVDAVAAGTLAAFGIVNATAILASGAVMASAVELAGEPGSAAQVTLLLHLSANLWTVGSLFFGLWLLPMGLLALRSGMPRGLGWLLLVGGTGYVVSAFVATLAPEAGAVAEALAIPASVAEFWMIGYLLHGGVFRRGAAD